MANQKYIYNNVVDYRLLDGAVTIEDVMGVTIPDVKNMVTEIDVTGLAAAIDVPDMTRFEKMTFKVTHNNGLNSNVLKKPGKHNFEFRMARQRMGTNTGVMGYVGNKFRIACLKTNETTNDVERGNPLGGSCEYSVLRLEIEDNGRIDTLIDVLAGIVKINGVDYSNSYKALLG